MTTFDGFPYPEQNWSKLPHQFIDQHLADIRTVSELKVVLYVLRHTWGFQEFGQVKQLTTDEFMHGRRRRDGSRMDRGTGLSNRSVVEGLRRAVDHGYLIVEVDDRDKGRIKKRYALRMASRYVESTHLSELGMYNLHTGCVESTHRSEKDTSERSRLWDHVLDELKLQTGRQSFDRWLGGSALVELDEERAVIELRDAYAVEWLDTRLRRPVERTLAGILGRNGDDLRVEFRVKSGDADHA